jgi:hypothetical protein
MEEKRKKRSFDIGRGDASSVSFHLQKPHSTTIEAHKFATARVECSSHTYD